MSFSFAAGCALCIIALQHKQSLTLKLQKFYEYLGWKQKNKEVVVDCDVCGVIKCNRHLQAPNREPWRGLFISRELDDALASVNKSYFKVFFQTFLNIYFTLSIFL